MKTVIIILAFLGFVSCKKESDFIKLQTNEELEFTHVITSESVTITSVDTGIIDYAVYVAIDDVWLQYSIADGLTAVVYFQDVPGETLEVMIQTKTGRIKTLSF